MLYNFTQKFAYFLEIAEQYFALSLLYYPF